MLAALYYRKYFPWAYRALERDNFKCKKCDETENIVVHHLDGSRRLGAKNMNNNLDNLITLCKPCHATIHGFRIKYLGVNGESIIELHNQGKTYQSIGDYFGISRQRVHQIIKKIS